MKKEPKNKLHIFSDGSVVLAVEAEGHTAEVVDSNLGHPDDVRPATPEEIQLIKEHGADKVKMKKGGKLERSS